MAGLFPAGGCRKHGNQNKGKISEIAWVEPILVHAAEFGHIHWARFFWGGASPEKLVSWKSVECTKLKSKTVDLAMAGKAHPRAVYPRRGRLWAPLGPTFRASASRHASQRGDFWNFQRRTSMHQTDRPSIPSRICSFSTLSGMMAGDSHCTSTSRAPWRGRISEPDH